MVNDHGQFEDIRYHGQGQFDIDATRTRSNSISVRFIYVRFDTDT